MHEKGYPRWADRFLKWYCRTELLEEIQGDLYEIFEHERQQHGLTKARRKFSWNVLRTFRLSTIKRLHPKFRLMSFRSHFKISYRQLIKQKYYSLINILGLAVGFCCCFFIGQFILQELSYDKSHPDRQNLFRLLTERTGNDGSEFGIYHNPPLAELAEVNLPEVQSSFRVRTGGSRLVKTGQGSESHHEDLFLYVDPSILRLLDFPLLYGDTQTALNTPNSIVLTEEKAQKYFGSENPVGKEIFLSNQPEQPFQVTGVVSAKRPPSHIDYDFYLSMSTLEESASGSWRRSSYPTYLALKPGSDQAAVEDKLQALAQPHKENFFEKGYQYKLQPISDIYLYSSTVTSYGHWPSGDPRYIWLFGAIGFVILLLAVINFVNLSTARSTVRAQEVGIRKILGSGKGQLISQYLIEAILQSLVGITIGLLIVQALIPSLEGLTQKALPIPWNTLWFIPSMLGIAILLGILAGLYPAFFLASFAPKRILQSRGADVRKGGLKWGLMTVQFAASFVLIFCTVLIFQQMRYVQQKNLGFDREQVIVLEDVYSLGERQASFKRELSKLPEVEHISFSSYLPVDGYLLNGSSFQHPDSAAGSQEVELRRWFIDEDYLEALDMQLVQGRNFSTDLSLDSNAIILNERAVEMLGFEDPIGQALEINKKYTVVGVVADFHFRSMKQDVLPLAFHHEATRRPPASAVLRYQSDNVQALLAKIEDSWKTFAPDQSLRYHFLDERFERMYASERRTGLTFGIFAGIAIFIACLGLFAMTTFTAEQRKKELSIRKILGATVRELFRLQTERYLKILALAVLIGAPIAYQLMRNWLDDFAYRINISFGVFLLSIGLTLFFVMLIISRQALRVANANPVHALRQD